MHHKLLLIYCHMIRIIFIWLPDMPLTMRFRGFLYSFGMKKCGKNFQVSSSAILRGIEKICCGSNVYIGPNAYVMARESIVIHDEVLVAMNVVIVDGNHGKINNSYRFGRGNQVQIVIGKGAWIAANSVVTAGSNILPGSIVPPCTVVRKL
ncbi:acyltransferase [Cronobacter dublinensis]|uniref:acyltransferase n=1 Tax=Cronobacter dublinensis TaxID=413497 RepID=UPI00300DC5EE